MKKLASVLLAIAFMFTLAIPSFAAESTASENLLENVTLELVNGILREDVSNTRAIFLMDEETIGGIEILDIAGQRETLPYEDDYINLAKNVTALVREGDFDCSVNKATGMSDVEVQLKFWDDGQCFVHYFFFGETVVYDIWTDYDVLDGQDMIHVLKTLHSPDIINPQDENPVNQDVPILNLRIDLPKGIQRMPTTKTRLLFYNVPTLEEYVTGENVVGGVEVVADGSDLTALEVTLADLGREYLGSKYEPAAQEFRSGAVVKLTLTSPEDKLVCYVVQVEQDAYAVWASTAAIGEEEILKIAESCCY
jgi:hypothetical protein